jgi:hypothetical protein
MPLTTLEEFKVGFLTRAAHEGWTPEKMLETVKAAEAALDGFPKEALFEGLGGKLLDAGSATLGTVLNWGIPAAVAVPPALGALGGYSLAKMHDVDDTDIREIKARELEDEYRRQTLGIARKRDAQNFKLVR